jgi:NAD(P)-dependent dehydrogenase (short-subunit alcohol dehydrogenase family)
VALINTVVARHGRIDILHNNAADLSMTKLDGDIEHTDVKVWDRIYHVNVRGTMLMCHYTLPHMVKQKSGSIINTASALGIAGAPVQAAYSASKAAEIQMCRSIATSHGKLGIRCNAVLPGLIKTKAAFDNLPPPLFGIQESENLTPYLGDPEDIAHAVAFLASDEARYITGQALVADGGSSAHIAGIAQMAALGPPPG